MSLMHELTITEFKRMIAKLSASEISELESFIVTAQPPGQEEVKRLFTVVVSPIRAGATVADMINTEVEYLGLRSNTAGGDSVEKFKSKETADARI